jgi:hypothetical protein
MDYQSSIFPIEGLIHGVQYIQQERVDELNDRYVARQFSDMPLVPNFDPRPVSTKYALFPCIDGTRPIHEPAVSYPEYNIASNFNPGTNKGPWNGFSQNVDTETILRNQTFALQRSHQKEYIPPRDSDLYNVSVISQPSEQPYPLLFDKQQYTTTPTEVVNQPIGKDTFFNHTRTQLRSL